MRISKHNREGKSRNKEKLLEGISSERRKEKDFFYLRSSSEIFLVLRSNKQLLKLQRNDSARKYLDAYAGKLKAGRRKPGSSFRREAFLLTLESSASLIARYVSLKRSALGSAKAPLRFSNYKKNKSAVPRVPFTDCYFVVFSEIFYIVMNVNLNNFFMCVMILYVPEVIFEWKTSKVKISLS